MDWASPIGSTANFKALEAGDAEGVIRAVLIDILEMTAEDVRGAAVHATARTENSWVYRPGALDDVRASTLVLVGTETAPALMQSTLRAAGLSGTLARMCLAGTDTWPA